MLIFLSSQKKEMRGFFVLVFIFFQYCFSSSSAIDVSYDDRALKIDGERKIIISGSIHYPRSTPQMWPSLIKKAKDGGLNAIETYVFWNAHEPLYRQYDFSGNLDLIRFIRTIQEQGLYVILRIGPYVCAEWNYGGLPVWLHNLPGTTFRTNNDVFKNEMKNFITLIVEMIKHEGLFASQGGPIILAQIENEYGDVIKSYGSDGKLYLDWCAKLAKSYDIGVPWIMCKEGDAPSGMINTCNGWYCDNFYPNKGFPKMWTENWTGWFKNWGDSVPHRTAEDVAFAVARFFQYGGTLQNYYMYHGGTNFGRTSGGPYISTSYDYDAPLDEYGNLNQPKWGHLKQLHELIKSVENILTYGDMETFDNYGNSMTVTQYSYDGKSVCFFGNANETDDIPIVFDEKPFTIPAWSVSIALDCYSEVYNTARVNTQTSIMVKKPNDADSDLEPYNLEWKWKAEHFQHLKFEKKKEGKETEKKKKKKLKKDSFAKGYIEANQLFDQKFITNDTSDYLWYMTSVEIDHKDPTWKEATLQVHSAGHVLHAFVNGKHVGSYLLRIGENSFDFETNFKTKDGNNSISLLSVTIGLQNSGDHFDKTPHGIVGPVKLIGGNSQVKDLQNNTWTYKVGLHGLDNKKLYQMDTRYNRKWPAENLPTHRMFVWYKTTFKAPLGEDPVVLDLLGLGKGIAWVNGHNIGRYWPSYSANADGCAYKCDYRGNYNSSKCLSGCGQSSQRWYHVPRSFLQADDNLLTLFEEFGGDPNNVKVQTVTVEKICGSVYEGTNLELSCQGGRVISEIKFASFGDPEGTCGSFRKGICESPRSMPFVQNACLGRESCLVNVSQFSFPSTCSTFPRRRFVVEAIC